MAELCGERAGSLGDMAERSFLLSRCRAARQRTETVPWGAESAPERPCEAHGCRESCAFWTRVRVKQFLRFRNTAARQVVSIKAPPEGDKCLGTARRSGSSRSLSSRRQAGPNRPCSFTRRPALAAHA